MKTADSALVVVDAQRGFADELPVPNVLDVVEPLNRLLSMSWRAVYATRDWHPADHCSFKKNGGDFPAHCVQNTAGACFLPGLNKKRFNAIFNKGMDPNHEAFSPSVEHPAFAKFVKAVSRKVFVAGVVGNVCVYETARSLRIGRLDVSIVEDACVFIKGIKGVVWSPKQAKTTAELLGIKYVKVADLT